MHITSRTYSLALLCACASACASFEPLPDEAALALSAPTYTTSPDAVEGCPVTQLYLMPERFISVDTEGAEQTHPLDTMRAWVDTLPKSCAALTMWYSKATPLPPARRAALTAQFERAGCALTLRSSMSRAINPPLRALPKAHPLAQTHQLARIPLAVNTHRQDCLDTALGRTPEDLDREAQARAERWRASPPLQSGISVHYTHSQGQLLVRLPSPPPPERPNRGRCEISWARSPDWVVVPKTHLPIGAVYDVEVDAPLPSRRGVDAQ